MPIKIENLTDLISIFGKSRKDKRWLFRGQSDSSWPVIPKAGRNGYSHVEDEILFRMWMKRACAHINFHAVDEWDWLAIAQHHGLATRLLDWSMNPLIAAYFAVSGSPDKDGIIYAIHCLSQVDLADQNPWSITKTVVIKPRGVVPRIVRQGGAFTCHAKPEEPLALIDNSIDKYLKFTIRIKDKKTLMDELSYFGTNAYAVYPDLDGLSTHINWTATSKEYY